VCQFSLDEKGGVEVDEIETAQPGGKVGRRRDRQRALHHRPQHQRDAVESGEPGDFGSFEQAAFHGLDVDGTDGARIDGPAGIGQRTYAFVGADQRAAAGQRTGYRREAIPVVLRHRLLQQRRPRPAFVEPVQKRQHPFGAEPHVCVQNQLAPRCNLPHRQNALQVQLLVPADLDLERGEPLASELPRPGPRLFKGADDNGDVRGKRKPRRPGSGRSEEPVKRDPPHPGGDIQQGHLQGRQAGMVAGKGRRKLLADLRRCIDPAPGQGSGRGLKVGQRRCHGLPGDVGRHRRFTVAADTLTGPQAEKDVGQFVVLAGRDPERGNQRRPDDGSRRIGDHKGYVFHVISLQGRRQTRHIPSNYGTQPFFTRSSFMPIGIRSCPRGGFGNTC